MQLGADDRHSGVSLDKRVLFGSKSSFSVLIFIRLAEVINEKVKAHQTHSSWLLKLLCHKVSAPGIRLGRLGLGSPCHRPPCVPSSLPPCCTYGYLISCSSVFMGGWPDELCCCQQLPDRWCRIWVCLGSNGRNVRVGKFTTWPEQWVRIRKCGVGLWAWHDWLVGGQWPWAVRGLGGLGCWLTWTLIPIMRVQYMLEK